MAGVYATLQDIQQKHTPSEIEEAWEEIFTCLPSFEEALQEMTRETPERVLGEVTESSLKEVMEKMLEEVKPNE